MVYIEHDDGSTLESVVIRSDEVIVQRADLLHCLQVAVWRAGLLEQQSLHRIKEALGIGEDESVPKPGVR